MRMRDRKWPIGPNFAVKVNFMRMSNREGFYWLEKALTFALSFLCPNRYQLVLRNDF